MLTENGVLFSDCLYFHNCFSSWLRYLAGSTYQTCVALWSFHYFDLFKLPQKLRKQQGACMSVSINGYNSFGKGTFNNFL